MIHLSFDDAHVFEWGGAARWLRDHAIPATFYVSEPGRLSPGSFNTLRAIADHGHSIQFHGTRHRRADSFLGPDPVGRFLREEIEPGLSLMRRRGFDCRHYSYPKGCSSPETDRALRDVFLSVRKTLRPGGRCVYDPNRIPFAFAAANIEKPTAEALRLVFSRSNSPVSLIAVFLHRPARLPLETIIGYASDLGHRFISIDELHRWAKDHNGKAFP